MKNNPQANEAAFAQVRADKEREVRDGHDGTWVAHPDLMPVAKEVFDRMPQPNQLGPLREDHWRRSGRARSIRIWRAAAYAKAIPAPGSIAVASLARSRALLIFAAAIVLFQIANAAMLPIMAGLLTMRTPEWATPVLAICILAPQVLVAAIAPWVGRKAPARDDLDLGRYLGQMSRNLDQEVVGAVRFNPHLASSNNRRANALLVGRDQPLSDADIGRNDRLKPLRWHRRASTGRRCGGSGSLTNSSAPADSKMCF